MSGSKPGRKMKNYAKLTTEEWLRVKTLWESGMMRRAICRQFNLSEAGLSRRAKVEGWVLKPRSEHMEEQIARAKQVVVTAEKLTGDTVSTYEQIRNEPDLKEELLPAETPAEAVARDQALATLQHRQSISALKRNIHRILKNPELIGTSKSGYPRAMTELATALNTMVKLERQVLGIDTVEEYANRGVIVVMAKLDQKDWQEAARRVIGGGERLNMIPADYKEVTDVKERRPSRSRRDPVPEYVAEGDDGEVEGDSDEDDAS